jgi:hypothetical protein
MGELEMVQEYYLISLMIFLKKYVILKSNSKTICRGNGVHAQSPNQVAFAKPL